MSSKKWHEFGPFTVFDVETTGMSPVHNRIVEIAAARIDQNGTITRFQSLVNPGCPIPPQVSCVHLITDEMVADAPKFHEVGYKFLDMARGSTLVAHNARFDLGFLQESLARCGLELMERQNSRFHPADERGISRIAQLQPAKPAPDVPA